MIDDLELRIEDAIKKHGPLSFEDVRIYTGVKLNDYRVLDRALQRMRKADRIQSHRRRWQLVNP